MANPLDFITEDQSEDGLTAFDQAKMRGISIRPANVDVASAGNDPLTRMVAPEPQAQQPWTMEDLMKGLAALKEHIATGEFSPGTKIGNRLFGTGGEERHQLWPERMIRSGLSLPGDVMSGAEPVIDPATGRTSERVIERAQDVAGLTGGSALAERPGAASMGSGPVRPGNVRQMRKAANENVDVGVDPVPEYYIKTSKEQFDVIPQGDKYIVDNGMVDRYNPFHGQTFDTAEAAKKAIRGKRRDVHDVYMRDGKSVTIGDRTYKSDPVHMEAHFDRAEAEALIEHLKQGKPKGEFKLLSDTQQPGAAIAAAASSKGPAPVFYSALEHAATNAAQEIMSPQQWLGYLKNQPGVKQEELQWTGIGDWLGQQKGKVKKEDVQAYLDEHKVEIKDVTKSGKSRENMDMEDEGYMAVREQYQRDHPELDWDGPNSARTWSRFDDWYEGPEGQAALEQLAPGGGTKYSSYQLPGGENYREHLLTLPRKGIDEIDQRIEQILNTKGTGSPEYGKLVAERARLKQKETGEPYRSSHWDEPNVLAHVRTNDRWMGDQRAQYEIVLHKDGFALKGPEGLEKSDGRGVRNPFRKGEVVVHPDRTTAEQVAREYDTHVPDTGKKSLHIEEIQSDWHQQGRKQGYKEDAEKSDLGKRIRNLGITKDLNSVSAHDIKKAGGSQILADEWGQHVADSRGGTVPDAPFKTSWPELALKRMIRHAAENGYDRISWTPGEAQAARYDLSKTVNKVEYHPEMQRLTALGKRGEVLIDKEGVKPEQLGDYIGKDISQKLLETKTKNDRHTLEGDTDLKVGGEGMREFYDKILPKMAEKIGKAHGVKVKQTQLGKPPAEIEHMKAYKDAWGKEFPEKWTVDNGQEIKTFQSKKEAEDFVKTETGSQVYYFDIPPSLRDHAIGKGFPLYMSGIPFPLTPVDHDPFKKEK